MSHKLGSQAFEVMHSQPPAEAGWSTAGGAALRFGVRVLSIRVAGLPASYTRYCLGGKHSTVLVRDRLQGLSGRCPTLSNAALCGAFCARVLQLPLGLVVMTRPLLQRVWMRGGFRWFQQQPTPDVWLSTWNTAVQQCLRMLGLHCTAKGTALSAGSLLLPKGLQRCCPAVAT